MKYILLVFIGFLMVSCGNEKTIQLPEIDHSEITEIHDVSAAYLFYDETQKDSVEFNRKNLIGTTNWLVNVDKRLTLKQAIPHIKYLQDKRRNAQMHKNENAKNYFTCNDTSRNNLGFIEFTDVVYCLSEPELFFEVSDIPLFSNIQIEFSSREKINLVLITDKKTEIKTNKTRLYSDLNNLVNTENVVLDLILLFKEDLSFDDYIYFKSMMSSYKNNSTFIMLNEFIY